jgi:uracil-DNA glycosylase
VEAKIMFIGEAPGRSEDEQGKPFVGRAGMILDRLLGSIGVSREEVFICNILKCRPPSNRNPLPDEIRSCVGSLNIQIRVIDPLVIATLGKFATTTIFEKFNIPVKNISAIAGSIINVDTEFGSKTVVPLFHPAVATYDASKFDRLKQDFQKLKPFLKDKKAADDPDRQRTPSEVQADQVEIFQGWH